MAAIAWGQVFLPRQDMFVNIHYHSQSQIGTAKMWFWLTQTIYGTEPYEYPNINSISIFLTTIILQNRWQMSSQKGSYILGCFTNYNNLDKKILLGKTTGLNCKD